MSKQTSDGVNPVSQKFIVDINSQLPVILCVMDGADTNLLTSSYYYADAQVLHQRHHAPAEPEVYASSWYVHDRLGSVRLVVRAVEEPGLWAVRALNTYTYTAFGQFQEGQCVEHIANPWKFTSQWHDAEIDQYHLRARQYDPAMMRFTSRDPVAGVEQEPLTLHKYLYCLNNPINRIDPSGLYSGYDDAAFAVAGAIGGFLEVALGDLLSGNLSNPSVYLASIFGGAVGGWASLYVGPGGSMIGGAVQGFVSEFVRQAINGDIDAFGLMASTGAGMLPGPRIPGITSGRGSFAAVTKQMVTKMQKGLVHRITSKTFSKIVAHNLVTDMYATILEGSVDAFMRCN